MSETTGQKPIEDVAMINMEDLTKFTGVSADDVLKVYARLSDIGLIDYDTEKEFLYEVYGKKIEVVI